MLNIAVIRKFFNDLVSLKTLKNVEYEGNVTRYTPIEAALAPNSYANFIFHELEAGNYSFIITHDDNIVLNNRKRLLARIRTAATSGKKVIKQDNGIIINKRKTFFFLGGGRIVGNQIVQFQNFTLTKPVRWVSFTLESSINRYINIGVVDLINLDKNRANQLAYLNAKTISKAVELKKTFEKPIQTETPIVIDRQALLRNHLRLKQDITTIIHAYIDLSVIDGSSIWFTSAINIFSSFGKVLVVSKSNIKNNLLLDNLIYKSKVTFITPADLNSPSDFTPEECSSLMFMADYELPYVQNIVVRGMEISLLINQNREFKFRTNIYLTDFYKIQNGVFQIEKSARHNIQLLATQATNFFTQTEKIEETLKNIADEGLTTFTLPPPIPDNLPKFTFTPKNKGEKINISYTGKISPEWGILELIEWTEKLIEEGYPLHLTIIANKISNPKGNSRAFQQSMAMLFKKGFITHLNGLAREEAISTFIKADFAWCYRPAALEDNTLELSTKLVEAVATGARAICYPSDINKKSLSTKYPYFIKTYEDFKSLIEENKHEDISKVSKAVIKKHSLNNIIERYGDFSPAKAFKSQKLLFAGHDFKFVDAYMSHLKSQGHAIKRDSWEWGGSLNERISKENYTWADTIFCEWGLANAVFYSKLNVEKKPLYIRMHLQEIKERARKFGKAIVIDNVTKVIFVSEEVRNEALRLWGWDRNKTIVIPNYVLNDEYTFKEKDFSKEIVLGMVGIIPQRKRFDRAVSLLKLLQVSGIKSKLLIKGPRPESIEYMHAPSRVKELDYYNDVYKIIEQDDALKEAVIFEGWGNDVALFYKKINCILSPSDFESFHYALADGASAGCLPLIWDWEEASTIYTKDWIVKSEQEALEKIISHRAKNNDEQISTLKNNRQLIQQRYGYQRVFELLSTELKLEKGQKT